MIPVGTTVILNIETNMKIDKTGYIAGVLQQMQYDKTTP
ncbi:hypothetical protein MNB_SV-4-47 [hydrothermal vent metagenome]|uniref:Uncharacterized protein n=1 Tax=hydrothermal vent metagenome TaxID=652676 RepID=A0A1W1EA03_9ZZZZ